MILQLEQAVIGDILESRELLEAQVARHRHFAHTRAAVVPCRS